MSHVTHHTWHHHSEWKRYTGRRSRASWYLRYFLMSFLLRTAYIAIMPRALGQCSRSMFRIRMVVFRPTCSSYLENSGTECSGRTLAEVQRRRARAFHSEGIVQQVDVQNAIGRFAPVVFRVSAEGESQRSKTDLWRKQNGVKRKRTLRNEAPK
jgi:hypothetical protein